MHNRTAWWTAGFACLALMVSNGMTVSGLSVYDLEFMGQFGWSLGEIKFRDMVTLTLTGLLAPLVGILIDRFGVRRCMLTGWILLSLAYLAYSRLESLAELYVIHAIFAVVLLLCGLNVAIILVSNWFVRYRGTAIGIALTGTSLGGALFPQYGTAMIAAAGWQQAFALAAVFPLLLLALTWALVRDRPGSARPARGAPARGTPARGTPARGTAARGAPARGSSSPSPGSENSGMAFREAIGTGTFWALALIAMSTFYTVLGVQAHIFKYMRDAGFDAQLATNAISLFFLCALAGKFLFGLVADFLPQRRVFFGNLLVMLVGSLALAQMDTALVWPAVVTFGLGWGGVYTLLQLTVMNSFGTRDAGKILGTITILDASGGGLGIWLTGLLYDRSGSYDLPFAVFTGLVLFALLCLTRVKPLAGVPAQVSQPELAGS